MTGDLCSGCKHPPEIHDEPGENGFAWCEGCEDLCDRESPAEEPHD